MVLPLPCILGGVAVDERVEDFLVCDAIVRVLMGSLFGRAIIVCVFMGISLTLLIIGQIAMADPLARTVIRTAQRVASSPLKTRKGFRVSPKAFPVVIVGLLLEQAVVEADEASGVASLVLCHLMDSIVQGIRALGLGFLCSLELLGTGALLGSDACFKVALGITEYVA